MCTDCDRVPCVSPGFVARRSGQILLGDFEESSQGKGIWSNCVSAWHFISGDFKGSRAALRLKVPVTSAEELTRGDPVRRHSLLVLFRDAHRCILAVNSGLSRVLCGLYPCAHWPPEHHLSKQYHRLCSADSDIFLLLYCYPPAGVIVYREYICVCSRREIWNLSIRTWCVKE